jgi:release factor glutamine methyltransferase
VGTGSGCLAVTLAAEFPHARIFATDVSAAALSVARRNAAKHGVATRIEFLECNLLDAFLSEGAARTTAPDLVFDLIVSNPPYVALADAASLPREVRDHEPAAALFAGESGLDVYAPLIRQAEKLLAPGGMLALELGHNAALHVDALLSSASWRDIAVVNDLAGVARVASALRN